MKTSLSIALAVTSIASTVSAKHGDAHLRALEHRHLHHKGRAFSAIEKGFTPLLEEPHLEKRTGQCQFPDDAGLVSVPGASNGGWAMSPDQCCEPGGYCPYACPPGQISMQWDPKATSYSYPQSMVSMHAGLRRSEADARRTEVFSATRVVKSRSRSQTSLTVSMGLAT